MGLPDLLCSLLIQYARHLASSHLKQPDSNLREDLDGFLLIQASYCLMHQSSQLLILFHPGLCQLMLLMHLIKALLAQLHLFLIGKLKIFPDLGNLIGQLLADLL